MTIRTQLKAGRAIDGWDRLSSNHNETLKVRTALKAGTPGHNLNHNEALQVRTALKAGKPGHNLNHNEALQHRS